MDCSPLGSYVLGIFSGKNTGVSCHFLLQRISPTQGSTRVSCVCCIGRQILTISTNWEALVSWLNYLLISWPWAELSNSFVPGLSYLWRGSCCCSVTKSCLTVSLQPHGLHHARLPSPSLSLGACSNSYPLSHWCHPTISSFVTPFSSYLQPFPASGSFLLSQLFASGDKNIGTSASILPMNIQGWLPLELTVHEISQARALKWVAMPSSQESNLGLVSLLHRQAGSLLLVPPGKPQRGGWWIMKSPAA